MREEGRASQMEPGGHPDRSSRRGWDFDTFYRARLLYYVRLARLLVTDLSTAEDIVQDAFAAFHTRLHTLADESKYDAYMRASVANGARSVLRHRRVVATALPKLVDPAPANAAEMTEDLLARQKVLLALSKLPSRQRQVLVFRYYLDLPDQQIADDLGISVCSVRSSISRGLAKLREEEGAP